MFRRASRLFNKDLTSELRTRYMINAQGMFIIVTISVIMFGNWSGNNQRVFWCGLWWW
ncbi:MAG: hypothetical protein IPN18_07120 [Ignavibacteriales bacterium]|nr:hypothetical protein [Ignavibacteriales bacterium]